MTIPSPHPEPQAVRRPDGAIQLCLPLPPSVNSIWRRGKGGRVYRDSAAQKFEQIVAAVCLGAGVRPVPGNFAIRAFVFNAPARDIDNVAKVLLDSMQRVVYDDDRQVAELSLKRCADSGVPRLQLTITREEHLQ